MCRGVGTPSHVVVCVVLVILSAQEQLCGEFSGTGSIVRQLVGMFSC